jgi:hypothetical protein
MSDRKSIVVSTAEDYNHVQDHFSSFGPINKFVHKNHVYEIEYKVMPSVRRAIENSDLYTYRIWPKAPLPVYAKSSGRFNCASFGGAGNASGNSGTGASGTALS